MRWQGVMSLLRCLDCRFLFDTMKTQTKAQSTSTEIWKDIRGAVLIVAAWDYRKNIEVIYGAKNQ